MSNDNQPDKIHNAEINVAYFFISKLSCEGREDLFNLIQQHRENRLMRHISFTGTSIICSNDQDPPGSEAVSFSWSGNSGQEELSDLVVTWSQGGAVVADRIPFWKYVREAKIEFTSSAGPWPPIEQELRIAPVPEPKPFRTFETQPAPAVSDDLNRVYGGP